MERGGTGRALVYCPRCGEQLDAYPDEVSAIDDAWRLLDEVVREGRQPQHDEEDGNEKEQDEPEECDERRLGTRALALDRVEATPFGAGAPHRCRHTPERRLDAIRRVPRAPGENAHVTERRTSTEA
jgi:hypothetical protein